MKIIAGIGCVRSEIRKLGFAAPELAVFIYVLSHADEHGLCWPSIRLMARALHLRQGTISDSIERIETAGVWRAIRRHRASFIIEFRSIIFWNCIPADADNSVNCIPADAPKPQTASLEANEVRNPENVARRYNSGSLLETDFWQWFASIPIMGRALHDPGSIPISTKRRGKWLLNYAWNYNAEFVKACKAIDEWYSWPWTKSADERKRSIGALMDNFTDQARLAEFHIEQRKQFRVIDGSGGE